MCRAGRSGPPATSPLVCIMPHLCARSLGAADAQGTPYPQLRPSGKRQSRGTAAPDSQTPSPVPTGLSPSSSCHRAKPTETPLSLRLQGAGGSGPSRSCSPKPLFESPGGAKFLPPEMDQEQYEDHVGAFDGKCTLCGNQSRIECQANVLRDLLG